MAVNIFLIFHCISFVSEGLIKLFCKYCFGVNPPFKNLKEVYVLFLLGNYLEMVDKGMRTGNKEMFVTVLKHLIHSIT